MNARIERLKELLKQSPSDAFVLFALAKEFEKVGNHQQAIDFLQNLIESQPDYVGAYYHLAALLKSKDRNDEAMKIYNLGMDIARKIGDQHAYSELQNAKMNLEIEMD